MPRPTRRAFLGASLGASFGARIGASTTSPIAAADRSVERPRAVEPLDILILGGTGFLGPAIVETAVARGHTMTLFNRGRTNTHLFPDLEKLKGDRDTGDLRALAGDRAFDAIIDTSCYVPGHVAATAGMFAERARRYVIVSSISVYPAFGEKAIEVAEDAELATVPDEVVAEVKTIGESFRDNGRYYGGFKALCEKAAEDAMPGRVAQIRPGLIVGPRDNSDRFTWWPVRAHKGGEVLAPGDPGARIQFVDARDLGAWIVHATEQNLTGAFNATGFPGPVTMQELLHGCKCATSTPCTLTWVDEEFLKEQSVGAWMEMPLWLPREGRTYANNDRALAHGLTFRPIADTIRDTLTWALEEEKRRPMFRRTGIAPDRERAVLAGWRAAKPTKVR